MLAVLIVFTGLVACHQIACAVARRKSQRAAEALNSRYRVGL